MYEYFIREVVKVVDGDTIDAIIDLGFDIMFASRIRLAGIDTPESRTKDQFEKKLGLESKKYLSDMLKDAKGIVVKTEKINSTEKFGRVLGWIYVNGEHNSLNNIMIRDGYAWPYLGKEKVKDFNALLEARKDS
jgi:micrococcal nuclease